MASKFEKMMAAAKAKPSSEEVIEKSQVALGLSSQYASREILDIELDAIMTNPLNDYAEEDNAEDIKNLAQDIKRSGLLHNIVISYRPNGDKILISGERRLRAYKILRDEEPENEEWQTIPTLMLKGLDELDEMIMLDAANLMTRGGGANSEKQFRKATARFVDNLKKKNKIKDSEAIAMASNFIAASTRTIKRNLAIENNLDDTLTEYVDRNIISKDDAASIAARGTGEQGIIRENISELVESGEIEDAAKYSSEVAEAVRARKPVTSVAPPKPIKAADAPSATINSKRELLYKQCEKLDMAVEKIKARKEQIRILDKTEEENNKLAAQIIRTYNKLGALINELNESV